MTRPSPARVAPLVVLCALLATHCGPRVSAPREDTTRIVNAVNPWAASSPPVAQAQTPPAAPRTASAGAAPPPRTLPATPGANAAPPARVAIPAPAAAWPDLSQPLKHAQGGGERDGAVIVGLEDYPFVVPVPGAVHNARDWFTYLIKDRRVPLSRVALLRDREGTRERILEKIAYVKDKLPPGGTLWFVFIGHGAPSRDGREGTLVTIDAQQDADNLYSRSLSQRALLEALAGEGHTAVAVLDTCFSGRTGAGAPLIPGVQPLVPVIKPAAAPPGAVILTAGTAQQFAGDLPGLQRPAFSYLLLGALRGWGDRDRDTTVTAEEAIAYTREVMGVVLKARTQTPQVFTQHPRHPLAVQARDKGPDLFQLVLDP